MRRLLRFVTAHPWPLLVLAFGLALASTLRIVDPRTGELRLPLDVSANRLLPEGDPTKEFYERVRRVFGNDETLLVALHAEDVFTSERLRAIERITERIERLEDVLQVGSLVRARNIRGVADEVRTRPLFDAIPDDPTELARIRREALSSPLFRGTWVSKDGRTAAILVSFVDLSDAELARRGRIEQIARIVREERGDLESWITGQPRVKVAQIEAALDELRRDIPLIFAVFAVVLAISFHTVRGVVAPLASLLVSLVWMLGIATWIGRPFHMVTILAPALVAIIGLSYAIHVVSEYYEELRRDPNRTSADIVAAALRSIWLPQVLTALSTSAGFAALLANPVIPVREFGQLALVGVALALLTSLTVLPALLAAWGIPTRGRRAANAPPSDRFGRFSQSVATFVLEHRRHVLWGAALLGLLFAVGATRIEVTSEGIRSFAPSAPVRIDFERINDHLDGATAFHVVVEASYPRAFEDPEVLREIERLQGWLEEQPEIGHVTSIVDLLRVLNRALHADDPAYAAIPDSPRMVATLLFFGAGTELDRLVDTQRTLANLHLRTPLVRSHDVDALVRRIESRLAELPPHLRGTVTGNPIVLQRMVDDIVRGQAISVLGALAMIHALLSVMFLSVRTGFLALLPNTVPVAALFGGLGWFGVPLGTATSILAPIALGIAIDDTIHYFHRFHRDAKRLANERTATVGALRTVGRPMAYTTVALCAGLLVLTTSDLTSHAQFGAMGAFTLAIALVMDFTLTPALCSGLRVVTLWDTLTLDLGPRPQESIPLFRGLSTAQCRIVAQMATVRRVNAAEPLLRTGEQGREMYVVIDGKLRVSIDTPEGPVVLGRPTRGATIGEVGFFHRRRTADVWVEEDARLLRLTQKNMTELLRRRPRIAAVLFRNLNAVMADLVSRSTDRLR